MSYLDDDPLRGTGRTLAKALHAIANALESPDVWVTCVDHIPSNREGIFDLAIAIESLAHQIGVLIDVRPCPDAVQLRSPISQLRATRGRPTTDEPTTIAEKICGDFAVTRPRKKST